MIKFSVPGRESLQYHLHPEMVELNFKRHFISKVNPKQVWPKSNFASDRFM